MNMRYLFRWFYGYIRNYNLFVPEIHMNDNQSQESAIALKHQRYATWLYILLLIVSIYVVFVIAFMTPQTTTKTISNLTPAIFAELHLEHGKTLSCPCSTISVPYKDFVFNTIKFHPICSSFFVSQQWIEALYLSTASTFNALDFRKTAHSQFKLLARFCLLSKETISQNQLNVDNNEFLSLYLLPQERIRAEAMATVELFKNSTIVRIISFINYLRIITRTNYFVSALNTNLVIKIIIDRNRYSISGGWMQFHNDTYESQKAEITCGTANPIRPSGFYDPTNDWYAGLDLLMHKLTAFAMVDGFFAGCTPLEALLPSTLDCLYDVKCLVLLLDYFPTLNQLHLNWSDHVLPTKKQNISLNDHLLDLFLEQWSIEMNYSMYFNRCNSSLCTYTTREKTNFLYAITLLISLYGGLVFVFRLIVPLMVNTISKLKHYRRNSPIDSGYFKTSVLKFANTAKQLNLFKEENERTEDNIRQQKLTTRVYLILLAGMHISPVHIDAPAKDENKYTNLLRKETRNKLILQCSITGNKGTGTFLILALFTSLKTHTTTITVSNPPLNSYNILENLHPNAFKCPCSTMTIPYHTFISLSPVLHQVCSSDFVRDPWISIMMSITYQSVPIDWRNQAGPQFQLLSDLCHLANKTTDDAISRFVMQSFITSNALNEFDFNRQLNATIEQFFQSTIISFGQIVDTVDLFMQVDQPLMQLGSASPASLTNIFVGTLAEEFNTGDSLNLKYLLPGTHDINSSSVNCICATNPHCQSLVAIYNNDEFYNFGKKSDLGYIVPGMIAGCFVIDSLMLSTLECFYSKSDCISIISSYIEQTYYRSIDYPQPIDVRPLVYDSVSNRFASNASIASIVREMMIEKWNPSVSYSRYYELCAPSYCAYSDTLRAKTTVGIITSLLSTIGGLCASLKLITPYILQLISRLLKWIRQRRHQQQQENQQGNCEFGVRKDLQIDLFL